MEPIQIAILVLLTVLIGIQIYNVFVRGKTENPKDERDGLLFLQQQMEKLRDTMDRRLSESNRDIRETVKTQLSESSKIVREVTEGLTKLGETNRQVIGFTEQLRQLQDVLKNPKQRGILGEYYLETVLQNVLPPGSFQMQYAFANGEIVDAAVFIKDKLVPREKMSDKITASFNPKGQEIWFFEQENFKGKKLVLKVGTYTLEQMGFDWNDRISSVLIPEGFEVQIYTNDNFSGNTTDLNGYWQGKTTMQRWRNEGYSQLKTVEGDPYNTNFDNAVSSIQIFNQRGS